MDAVCGFMRAFIQPWPPAMARPAAEGGAGEVAGSSSSARRPQSFGESQAPQIPSCCL